MNDYICKQCGKTVQRNSDKPWIKSLCSETDKFVKLVKVEK